MKNFPFSSFGRNIYIFSQVPKKVFSRGRYLTGRRREIFSREVIRKGFFSCEVIRKNSEAHTWFPARGTENSQKTRKPLEKPLFRDLREDKLISCTQDEKGKIFTPRQIVFGSRQQFLHSNWWLRLVLVPKLLSRAGKNSSWCENLPLFVLRTKYIYLLSGPEEGVFSGSIFDW